MIALKSIPTRTEATNGQIAKRLARLGCTAQQIQTHLSLTDKVEPKAKTRAAWSKVHWVKPWEVRFE
jgi:hypothetical protein